MTDIGHEISDRFSLPGVDGPPIAVGVAVLDAGDLRAKGSECLTNPSLKTGSSGWRSRTVIFAT